MEDANRVLYINANHVNENTGEVENDDSKEIIAEQYDKKMFY